MRSGENVSVHILFPLAIYTYRLLYVLVMPEKRVGINDIARLIKYKGHFIETTVWNRTSLSKLSLQANIINKGTMKTVLNLVISSQC